MAWYIFRRILFAVPIALGVSIVCFSLVYLAPGDPLQTVLLPDATAETIAIVKHAYGFDRPIPVQYSIWLWHVLHGDFGRSIATQRAVTLEVFGSLANTAVLALFAVPIAFAVGYAMGAVAGCFPGRIVDRIVTGTAVVRGAHDASALDDDAADHRVGVRLAEPAPCQGQGARHPPVVVARRHSPISPRANASASKARRSSAASTATSASTCRWFRARRTWCPASSV